MSNITITYRPLGFLPFERKISRSFPESFQELTERQYISVAGFFEKKKPLVTDQIILIKQILNISKRIFFRMEDFQVHQLINQLDWMANIAFNKVFIKSFIVDGVVIQGPRDGFQDVIFDEFAHTDTFFARYCDSDDAHDLYMMIASLYRPQVDGKRKPFDDLQVNDQAAILSKADPEIINAILFNYKVLRRWIETLYPMVFPAAPDKEKSQKKAQSPGWSKVRRMMTGGELADVETIGRLPMHTVLAEMNDRIKDKYKNS